MKVGTKWICFWNFCSTEDTQPKKKLRGGKKNTSFCCCLFILGHWRHLVYCSFAAMCQRKGLRVPLPTSVQYLIKSKCAFLFSGFFFFCGDRSPSLWADQLSPQNLQKPKKKKNGEWLPFHGSRPILGPYPCAGSLNEGFGQKKNKNKNKK